MNMSENLRRRQLLETLTLTLSLTQTLNSNSNPKFG